MPWVDSPPGSPQEESPTAPVPTRVFAAALAAAGLMGELRIRWIRRFPRGDSRCTRFHRECWETLPTPARGKIRFQGFDSFNCMKYVGSVYLAISEVYSAVGNV